MILDSGFGPITDLTGSRRPAVMHGRASLEHGLFIGLVHDLIVAGASGVRHVRREGFAPVGCPLFDRGAHGQLS